MKRATANPAANGSITINGKTIRNGGGASDFAKSVSVTQLLPDDASGPLKPLRSDLAVLMDGRTDIDAGPEDALGALSKTPPKRNG